MQETRDFLEIQLDSHFILPVMLMQVMMLADEEAIYTAMGHVRASSLKIR